MEKPYSREAFDNAKTEEEKQGLISKAHDEAIREDKDFEYVKSEKEVGDVSTREIQGNDLSKSEQGFIGGSFDEELRFAEKLAKINKEKIIPLTFLKTRVTLDTLDKFLNSSLAEYITPDEILEHVIKLKNSTAIDMVIHKFGEKIDYEKFIPYGMYDNFKKLDEKDKKDAIVVSNNIKLMLHSVLIKEMRDGSEYEAANPSRLGKALEYIKDAIDAHVEIIDLTEKLSLIESYIGRIPGRYRGNVINNCQRLLAYAREKSEK